MSNYSYCKHPGCNMGMSSATVGAIQLGIQRCASGHANHPNRELIDVVEGLEQDVRELKSLAMKHWGVLI